jgi:aminopeptidase N
MLRHELGDETFRKCIQEFYEQFKYGNALTEDFLKVVEEVSGKEYATVLSAVVLCGRAPCSFLYLEKKGGNCVEINIKQHQEQHVFHFPLEIEISGNAGQRVRKTIQP